MNKLYAFVVLLLVAVTLSAQPLAGSKTIKAVGGDYASFNDAFVALNANGVGAGGVVFNVDAGFSSIENPTAITATGTSTNTIVFKKNGVGANPVLRPGGTVALNEFGIKILGGDYITFDGIDITINTASDLEYGYVLEGATANGCNYNTIKNCAITLNKALTTSRAVYTLIAASPTSASFANTNNKFYNINIQNCYSGYFLNANSTYPDQNNEIGTIDGGTSTITNIGGGTTTCTAISVTNQNFVKIFNQTITNITTTTAQINGILYSGTTTSGFVYNNTVSNLSQTSTSTSTVYGMSFTSTKNVTVYNNNIENISSTTGPAAGINASGSGTTPSLTFYGNVIKKITTSGTSALNSAFGFNNSGAGVTLNFYKNTVSNIENKSTSAAGLAVGVNISGTTTNVYNNYIYDIKTLLGTAAAGSRGLSLVGGTSNFYVYHNTVYLDHTPAAATGSGAALYLAAASVSFDIRNNIFVNKMTNTTGRSVAVYAAGATGYLTKFATVTDNNLYYAGTPSATNLIYYDGTNADQTLTDYKNRLATKEQHSITEIPAFISSTSPYDLHLNTTIATQCESGGQFVSKPINVDSDFDEDVRGGSYVDIGADEGNFVRTDKTGPYINYTPLVKTTLFVARTLTTTITDPSGVPTSGIGLPVLYWKINAAASYTPVTATYVSGDTYNFTFGGGVIPLDSISYYVVAQDMAATANALSNPSAYATGYGINAPAVTNAPVPPNSYKVVIAISENLFVGTGQVYTSLTGAAPGGLFAALKDAVVTKNLQVKITSDLVETAQNDLTPWLEEGVGGYQISFDPLDATNKVISSGSLVNYNGLIRLNGVDRATFNGAFNESGNYLLFRSKEDYLPVFLFSNDASNNTITNATIEGINSSNELGLIHFTNGTTLGNDSNLIANCVLRDRSDAVGKPQNLIVSTVNALTTPGVYNSGNSVINNKMYNFNYCGFQCTGLNENWTIANNEIYHAPTAIGGNNVYGINIGSQGVANNITQNKIHDLKFASGALAQVAGIVVQNSYKVNITKNRIYNFPSTSGALAGILFYGSASNAVNATVANNQITIAPVEIASQFIAGIYDNGYAGNSLQLYNNTILIDGASNDTTDSWAYLRAPLGATNNTLRNNIFYNNRSGNGSKNFAIGNTRMGTGQFVVSNNMYMGLGNPNSNIFDMTAVNTLGDNFAAWTAATNDQSSYAFVSTTTNPYLMFNNIATGDLSIKTNNDVSWYVNGKGLPLEMVTDDFEGTPRSTTIPTGSTDIGSHEFTTTTLPIILTPEGDHIPGGTEQFNFGGRTLATITWGAASTTLPTLGDVRHYTGQWPNDSTNNGTVTGAKMLNEYWTIPATGGSAFTYTVGLNYDSAMLGTITNENSMLINKRQSAVLGSWAVIAPTVVNVMNRNMTATGLSTFSEFTGTDFDHNLPVSLLSFSAVPQKDDVLLNWSTATEVQHRGFEIERSLDGTSFVSFATIAGAGNSLSAKQYHAIDAAALIHFKAADRVYYRLKMIGNNGQVSYSSIVMIRMGKMMGNLVQAVMPNPFINHVNISLNLPSTGIVTARVLDMAGKQLITNRYQAAIGFSTIQIANLGTLSKGMYLLELRYNNEVIVKKLIKE